MLTQMMGTVPHSGPASQRLENGVQSLHRANLNAASPLPVAVKHASVLQVAPGASGPSGTMPGGVRLL